MARRTAIHLRELALESIGVAYTRRNADQYQFVAELALAAINTNDQNLSWQLRGMAEEAHMVASIQFHADAQDAKHEALAAI